MAWRVAVKAALTGGAVLGVFILVGPVLAWTSYTWEGMTLGVVAWVVATVFIFVAFKRLSSQNANPS